MKTTNQTYPTGLSGHIPQARVFYFGLIKSIALMALGFIIVKITFSMIQATSLSTNKMMPTPSKAYAGNVGMAIVAVGLCSACYAYYQYCFRERQRKKGGFSPTPLPALFLTAGVLLLGLFLFSELLQGV